MFGAILSAAYGALGFGRRIHQPFFEAKQMQDQEIKLWVAERRYELHGIRLLCPTFRTPSALRANLFYIEPNRRCNVGS